MSGLKTSSKADDMNLNKVTNTRKIALSAILAATAIVLSPFTSFPLGFATPNPTQHMVNAIAGVFLGPWYAVFIAIVAALGRNILHTGTVFAFPRRYLWRSCRRPSL